MSRARALQIPPEERGKLRPAQRLEWLTIAYLVSVLVLSNSQAIRPPGPRLRKSPKWVMRRGRAGVIIHPVDETRTSGRRA